MHDQDKLIDGAVKAAISKRAPIELDLTNQGWLVVHPQADFVMVTVGSSASRVSPVQLLQRRHAQPERLSCWLPAMLNDGQLIVVKRLERKAGGGVESLGDANLELALELLA